MSPVGLRRVEVALVADAQVPEALSSAPRHRLLDVGGSVSAGPGAAVALVASPTALHVLFEVASEPPLRVAAVDGGPVWEDDCVELFVGRPEAPFSYREIVVNPAGSRYGAEVINPDESRATWTLAAGRLPEGLSVAVTGEPGSFPPSEWRRWSCRMTLPWRSLSGPGTPPRPGEERRLNGFRIARGSGGSSTRHLALSPTLRAEPPDFHVPSRFARAVFLPSSSPSPAC
ncbi:MAG: carbohydrate-binding family 9-like protein [Acidithiobacillales bacterium]